MSELTPAQKALIGYMEGQSELRWAAGWLSDLHTALLGDEAYEWLVEAAGGTFRHAQIDRTEVIRPTPLMGPTRKIIWEDGAIIYQGSGFIWMPCTVTALRESKDGKPGPDA